MSGILSPLRRSSSLVRSRAARGEALSVNLG